MRFLQRYIAYRSPPFMQTLPALVLICSIREHLQEFNEVYLAIAVLIRVLYYGIDS